MENLDNTAEAVSDDALFESVVSGEKPDSGAAVEVLDKVSKQAVTEQAETKQDTINKPAPSQQADAAIPSWRLREETERARAAEMRAAELERKIAELSAKIAPAQRPDLYENPDGFVQETAKPLLEPIEQRLQQIEQERRREIEYFSQREAMREFGAESVKAAYDAMMEANRANNPDSLAVYHRMMNGSLDPYGDMVRWYKREIALREVGTDLDAYRKRIIEEALAKDPDVRRRAIELARAEAMQPGRTVTQAQKPVVQSLPSLNKVGSVALESQDEIESDDELFEKATRRKRKGA
jgi:hypothetical protein